VPQLRIGRIVLRVALTGGIATGKSYVVGRLTHAGIAVVDADVLARRELDPGTPALQAVRTRFGEGVMHPDGTLNRSRLADIVFRDPAARRELEAMVHPGVMRAIDDFFARTCGPANPFAIADIPLLYEVGAESIFDRVIVVACPRDMQIARVMARDGATREAAERRIAAQLPIDEKVRRAHYIIRTGGSFEETDRQVSETLEKLRQES
jgi:dephospho-CoA kinase